MSEAVVGRPTRAERQTTGSTGSKTATGWRALWLGPHLLSLDAPLVALGWQCWWARLEGVHLRWIHHVVLVLAVWMIYLADRLADVREPLSAARHVFYRRQGKAMGVVLAAIVLSLAGLTVTSLAQAEFRTGLGLLALVTGYFALVHWRHRWLAAIAPKEVWVGALFSLGTGFFVWRCGARLSGGFSVSLGLFGILCFLNCALIAKWERCPTDLREPRSLLNRWPHLAANLGFGCVAVTLTTVLAAASGFLSVTSACPLIASSLGLWTLEKYSPGLNVSALRVLADAVLLTPWLFLLLQALGILIPQS